MLLLDPCQSEKAYAATQGHVNIQPKLLLMAMSEAVVLPQLGSVLMSVVHVTTGTHVSHVSTHVLNHELYKDLAELSQPLTQIPR